MKKLLTLSLATLMLMAVLVGCSGGGVSSKPQALSPEERTELYKNSIESARDAQTNDAYAMVTSENDEMASLFFDLMGLSAADMSSFVISTSPMNVQAYAVAAIYPAADKADTVKEALNGFIDRQKQSFDQYLMDQYDIANNTKLETLEDGTVLLVMCEGQDEVFTSIKTAIEAGPGEE